MASEAVRKQRAVRRRMFARTLMACGALFSALFLLMTAQLMLGRDPAVGAGKQPAAVAQVAQRPAGEGDLKSVAGRAIGAVVGSVLAESFEGDEEEKGGWQEPDRSAPAPAPVQSGSS
jgi:hypothetical protein